jgi:hypothetical protein
MAVFPFKTLTDVIVLGSISSTLTSGLAFLPFMINIGFSLLS